MESYGLEMLRPRERRCPRMPNATPLLIEQRVLAFSLSLVGGLRDSAGKELWAYARPHHHSRERTAALVPGAPRCQNASCRRPVSDSRESPADKYNQS